WRRWASPPRSFSSPHSAAQRFGRDERGGRRLAVARLRRRRYAAGRRRTVLRSAGAESARGVGGDRGEVRRARSAPAAAASDPPRLARAVAGLVRLRRVLVLVRARAAADGDRGDRRSVDAGGGAG